uniref:MFS domain-containing protein n=1 Tax=Syphacia muris TaxID=451379 RepID=A0A0N5AYB7_9BILA
MSTLFYIKVQQLPTGKWTGPLILAIFASCIGSAFQFGYHIGCINAPAEIIKQWYIKSHEEMFNSTITYEAVSRVQWAITVSSFAVGGMVGGLASGWCGDKFGRKGGMILNNILAVLATLLMGSAKYVGVYFMMMIGRVVIGLNAGLSSALVPMYLTELSPINLRGTIGSFNQLTVTIAILFSQFIGLPQIFGTPERWPFIFVFGLVPVVIQLLTLPLCPESPKYTLIVKNNSDQAEMDLKKLRGDDDVKAELKEMQDEAAAMAAVEKVSIKSLFKGEYAWPMFIAIMMMLAQQLSGINVAMFFSTIIFKNAGLGENAVYATLGMGLCNVIMTVISVYLVDHPRFGRRSLLLSGLIGMLFSSLALVLSITIYVSSIPWFFVSELFTSGARGSANSVAVMTNWLANTLVAVTFEFLMQILMQYSFLIFSTFLTLFIIFTYIFVPETKGRTVEEIYEEFKRGKSRFARKNNNA